MDGTLTKGCVPPPVIPGGTEKKGFFFRSDPESTDEVGFQFDRNDMTGWMGHPQKGVSHRLSFRAELKKGTFQFPPPVIPGGTEKKGLFFSSDPESTAEVGFQFDRNDMTGRWDTHKRVCPTACHSGRN
ncbi:hypothetical protein QUF72_10820 [Desulfobacterales bacterium HSG2]|nr:hypothetical protein [Desulfobacterales bacterium HSG2]